MAKSATITCKEDYEMKVVKPFGSDILWNMDGSKSSYSILIDRCFEDDRSVEDCQEMIRTETWLKD